MQFELDNILENMEKLFMMNQKYYIPEMIEDGLRIKEYREEYNKFIKRNIKILSNGFNMDNHTPIEGCDIE